MNKENNFWNKMKKNFLCFELVLMTQLLLSMDPQLVLPKGNTFKSEIITVLCTVHKELAKYQLGLKITHAYKPQPYQLKKHPDLYWIDVRTIDAHGNLQPLAIPRGYFSDSPVGGDDVEAYNISIQHNKNREIMYQLLKKYGFIHKNNNWEYKDAKRMRLCTLEIPVAWYGT